MPRAFYLILAVQFISTLADNAFLIVAIARVAELSGPLWLVPLLKISFNFFYVVLAPFVGALSDTLPKGRVMLLSNGCKVMALLALLHGVDPALAISLVGLGSAMYAPAKYGLITELLPPQQLVQANGFFEGATVCAVLSGTVVGGVLVSALMPTLHFGPVLAAWLPVHSALLGGMLGLLLLNLVALVLSVAVGDSGARYDPHSFHPRILLDRFLRENRLLWRDADGGMSMAVTTLLWGVAATLQLIVLRWAHEVFGLPLSQAAYMQGLTALGVIAGAMLASRWVRLERAADVLPLGMVLGLLTALLLLTPDVRWAALLLVCVGGVAGFFLVPMNALLQHRGCTLLTAGRSIAVQGFNENAGMLGILALYAAAVALGLPLPLLVAGFALFTSAGMALVFVARRRQRAR